MTAMLTVLRSLARLPLLLLHRTAELPLPGLLQLMLRLPLFLLRWVLSLDLFKGRLPACLREKGLSPRW